MTPTTQSMAPWIEQAWLQRYLARELSHDEVEWFEMYLLDRPHLLDALDTDSDLRDGVAMAAANAPEIFASAAPTVRRQRPPRLVLAWAASVAVAGLVGWLMAGALGAGPGGMPGPIADPTRIVYDTQRGVATPPLVFNRDSGSELIVLEVGLPADADSVHLALDDEPPIELTVSDEGFASVLLSRRQVKKVKRLQLTYESSGEQRSQLLDVGGIRRGDAL